VKYHLPLPLYLPFFKEFLKLCITILYIGEAGTFGTIKRLQNNEYTKKKRLQTKN
jgi:hypothetical protein